MLAATRPLAERLEGGVWGHLVGDAIGVPYEFLEPDEIGEIRFGATGSHRQPPGTWSDDGGLMLALLDSLLAVGFDPQDQAARMVSWLRAGDYAPGRQVFDVGRTTGEALRRYESGTSALRAGVADEWASGNGSLMRILPIALARTHVSDERLAWEAALASRVTHATPQAQGACALYALIARSLLRGADPQDALIWASAKARWTFARPIRPGADLRRLWSNPDAVQPPKPAARTNPTDWVVEWAPEPDLFIDRPVDPRIAEGLEFVLDWQGHHQGRAVVWDCFWSAWDAFSGAGSYRETVERSIGYGHDTDSTAAVAGGLAGIRWGVGGDLGVPHEWLAAMRGHEIADPLVARLVASATATWREGSR